MMKSFLTWDPVSCVSYAGFDEEYAYRNNKWFFDKSVWQKMLRAMSGCGFDALVLANTHPFPFMVDLEKYPEAGAVDEVSLAEYQCMHHWIMKTAIEFDIALHLLFFSVYVPDSLLAAREIDPAAVAVPSDFSLEYTHYCVRRLLDEYPELAGVWVDSSRNLTSRREEFVQHAIIDALDAVRPDAFVCLSGDGLDPEPFVRSIRRRGGRPIAYSASYTRDYLVDPSPDSQFRKWADAAGAHNIVAEVRPGNIAPWTCFSHETTEGISENLEQLGCRGLCLEPLSVYDWPKSSDTYFKYQFQRDMVWYSLWGGVSAEDLMRRGQPKWLLRNRSVLPGFEAGSRILELLALYFAPVEGSRWLPQFCTIADGSTAHLMSIDDMLRSDASEGAEWWEDVTGDPAATLSTHVTSGTQREAYGPDELMEELSDLAEQAIGAGDKGMRSASGEKELPGFARDVFCMGRLGEFYVERIRAALAHARHDDAEALQHMSRAVGIFREIRSVDSSHRGVFRLDLGKSAAAGSWNAVLDALAAEHNDAESGRFEPGTAYPTLRVDADD